MPLAGVIIVVRVLVGMLQVRRNMMYRLPSLTDKVLDAYKATLPMKLLSGDRALLRRADEIMADIAKLIKEKNPEQCVSLFQSSIAYFSVFLIRMISLNISKVYFYVIES
ncbi:MAG: hypothetical protein ACLUE2_00710 [Bacteroides cellulosilyticus]